MKKNLSIHWGHDSSLCLATNKEIIGFIELERISRIKSYSFKNIWKLDKENKEFEEIVTKFLNNFGLTVHDVNRIGLTRTANEGRDSKSNKKFYKSRIFFFDHHEAHAAVGYFPLHLKNQLS